MFGFVYITIFLNKELQTELSLNNYFLNILVYIILDFQMNLINEKTQKHFESW
jgi:hypothetical protein